MQAQIYFETLGEAFDAFKARTREAGGEFTKEPEFWGHVSYGETNSQSFELSALKGKKTKKWAHISLYRMESGRYELTAYIL